MARHIDLYHVDRSKDKGHPRDCNAIARDRAGSHSGAPTKEYEEGYDQINWKSKQ